MSESIALGKSSRFNDDVTESYNVDLLLDIFCYFLTRILSVNILYFVKFRIFSFSYKSFLLYSRLRVKFIKRFLSKAMAKDQLFVLYVTAFLLVSLSMTYVTKMLKKEHSAIYFSCKTKYKFIDVLRMDLIR